MIGDKTHVRRLRWDKVLSLVLFAAWIAMRIWMGRSFARDERGIALTLIATTLCALAIVSYYVTSQRRRIATGPDADPSRCKAHLVGIESARGGDSTGGSLVVEPERLVFSRAFSLYDEVVPAGELVSVHERPAWIELRCRDGAARVRPSSFQGRKDLLWDLALRCNAAMERGIDEDVAEAKRVAVPASAPSAVDDLPDLGSGIPGLGSALAGPAHRPNPAPPRKSGLGNGLFPRPDADAN